jgi:hypothetical protein
VAAAVLLRMLGFLGVMSASVSTPHHTAPYNITIYIFVRK